MLKSNLTRFNKEVLCVPYNSLAPHYTVAFPTFNKAQTQTRSFVSLAAMGQKEMEEEGNLQHKVKALDEYFYHGELYIYLYASFDLHFLICAFTAHFQARVSINVSVAA